MRLGSGLLTEIRHGMDLFASLARSLFPKEESRFYARSKRVKTRSGTDLDASGPCIDQAGDTSSNRENDRCQPPW